MTAGSGDPRRSILAGLLGQGVKPSLTPEMHEREAGRQRLRYVYKVIDLDEGQLGTDYVRKLLAFAVALGFDGLNVTHPLKQAMVPLVDRVTPDVEAIGALNTVLIDDGVTIGHNTDVTGFGRAFREALPDADLGVVMLLGAGGAGKAVAHALVRLGARRLLVFDPETDRAKDLKGSVEVVQPDADVTTLQAADLPDALAGASGLVNATPIGMAAHPGTPVPVGLLHRSLWVADIVYRPLVTGLLTEAGAQSCRTLSGAGMAVHQAADSFELITGRPADRKSMFRDFDEMVAVEVDGAEQATTTARETSAERTP